MKGSDKDMFDRITKKIDELNNIQLESYILKTQEMVDSAEKRFALGYSLYKTNRLDLAYDYLKEFIEAKENQEPPIFMSKYYDIFPNGCGGFTITEGGGEAACCLCCCGPICVPYLIQSECISELPYGCEKTITSAVCDPYFSCCFSCCCPEDCRCS